MKEVLDAATAYLSGKGVEQPRLCCEYLAGRPQIVVLNKMDLPDAQAWCLFVEEAIAEREVEIDAISAVTREGVEQLMKRTYELLQNVPPPEPAQEVRAVFRPGEREDAFTIEREEDAWRVRGAEVERVAAMTNWDLDEAVQRFQRIADAIGLKAALREAGVQPGDTVRIGEAELEWQ